MEENKKILLCYKGFLKKKENKGIEKKMCSWVSFNGEKENKLKEMFSFWFENK